MEFSYVLRQLRERKGLSQNDIAKHLGITRQAVTLYESGKREPDYQILKKLADYFGVSIDYLLGRSVCEDLNAVVIGKNIDFIRGNKSYKKMSEEIYERTGVLILPDAIELYCKGEKVPSTTILKVLAKYSGDTEAFLHIDNEDNSSEKRKGQNKNENVRDELQNHLLQNDNATAIELMMWSLKEENLDYIRLARDLKRAGLKTDVLDSFIKSMLEN